MKRGQTLPYILVFCILLVGCSRKEGYNIKMGTVYWGTKQTSWIVEKEIEKADAGSFEILARNLAKDKDSVFYQSKRLEGCSPTSVVLMGKSGFYCKDDTGGWIAGARVSEHPASFELLKGAYARDSEKVWFLRKELPKVQAAEFEVLPGDGPFGRDTERVYHGEKLLDQADPETFEVLDYYHGRDANRAYFEGVLLDGADGSTFEAHQKLWGKDKASVYYRKTRIEGMDAAKTTFLEKGYAKDDNIVVYNGNVIEGADAVTFRINEKGQAEDKHGRFSGPNRYDPK